MTALHLPPSPSTEVRVGTSGTANTVLAIWMAEDAGLYAKHNLKVTSATWAAAAAAPPRCAPASST